MGVEVEWVEGDAEDLPFEDGRFDRVYSAFGVMFAPRHEVTARELVRVCRPGGLIAVVNWTPQGQVGQLFKIMAGYLPAPPEFASPPPLWGDRDHVERLFEGTGVELEFDRATVPWIFDTPDDYVSFMETNYGPMVRAREALEPDGRWADCREEIVRLMEDLNVSTDYNMHVDAEYLLTLARKPG
jgi:SAM-dependent methyltransferase